MNTLLRNFLAIAFLVMASMSAQAADDLITQQITIKLDKAGTLPNQISSTEKYLITNLKVVGEINGTDMCLIRDMAGRDFEGKETSGKLSKLDLSEAKIVEGGGWYYICNAKTYYTSKDCLGEYAFRECSGLTSIIIPSSVTRIGEGTFWGCKGLTNMTIPSSVTEIGDEAFSGCSGFR